MSVYADISNKSFERDKKDFEVFQSPLTVPQMESL
ncbi:MAG: hypothetical protein Ct9H90mP22_4190 [Gammaproteobacteria bacterium]|nr:MAG: hypothetical protein Ct9H90mP22_4190 [Gammaproteobacteria bacterium]